jgi:hypothetical protein
VWEGKLEGRGALYASPTGADGKIYVMTTGGDVTVLAEGEAFKRLAHISLGERDSSATVVPAQGRLFVRTGETLYCIKASADN